MSFSKKMRKNIGKNKLLSVKTNQKRFKHIKQLTTDTLKTT